MIRVCNHTVMDGQVVRWYKTANAWQLGRETISASRNGVMGGDGALLDPETFAEAWAAHERLARREDVKDVATHTWSFGSDELIAVQQSADNRTENDHA